ncbi:Methyltransferase domain-containing protein [Haloechinothrix alba]|uniref:Methyltransferase domain-containing protein n=1 Tax=Haloechinothrix alba TaxID=664784 RepID=A0A238W509_9PSEU|nr:methyltransferase domain-containing protein [Haloechinothrix alba]SNR41253.1 Methyltransferase domain-containing protein [Haloechinothrix alba]
MTASQQLDQARVDEFMGKMVEVLSGASVALLGSIGHRLGLFDTLAELGDVRSEELAERAGLQERYVREWLGGVTTGGIVEYDPDAGTYRLPAEHAACLTRAAGPDNFATILRFIPLLAQVEGQVTDAFREGGGVGYAAFHDFHALMAEQNGKVFDASLIDTILPLVDGLPERLARGVDVADIGCGSGRALNIMAEEYPESRFVGYDFSEEAIATARTEAEERGLSNVRFELCDVTTLDVPGAFDVITAFDAIHDQARPATVLGAVYRALRPGGTFLAADIKASSYLEDNQDIPWAPWLYTVSTMHCMTVSLALGGDGLGTVWGRQRAVGMLDDAGFSRVDVREVETDPFNLYYVAGKD